MHLLKVIVIHQRNNAILIQGVYKTTSKTGKKQIKQAYAFVIGDTKNWDLYYTFFLLSFILKTKFSNWVHTHSHFSIFVASRSQWGIKCYSIPFRIYSLYIVLLPSARSASTSIPTYTPAETFVSNEQSCWWCSSV